MIAYLARRLGVSLIVLLGLSLLAFFLVRLAPGDTVTAMLGMHHNPADADALRQRYGLDRPLPTQYAIWLSHVVQGDLGRTIGGAPVTSELADALPVTVELMLISLGFALVTGLPLGVIAALRRNRPADLAATFVGLVGISIPGFWLGTLLILLFALSLRWLPAGQFVDLRVDPVANLRHMLLPGMALGTAVAAVIMRMTRASMLDVIRQDYVRTAEAKGLPRRRVVVKHALRNAMIPVFTVVGIQAGYLLGGSVVIEEVFSLNGVGRLALRAIGNRDYPLLQTVILLIGAAFVLINLSVDLLVAWVDPRIKRA